MVSYGFPQQKTLNGFPGVFPNGNQGMKPSPVGSSMVNGWLHLKMGDSEVWNPSWTQGNQPLVFSGGVWTLYKWVDNKIPWYHDIRHSSYWWDIPYGLCRYVNIIWVGDTPTISSQVNKAINNLGILGIVHSSTWLYIPCYRRCNWSSLGGFSVQTNKFRDPNCQSKLTIKFIILLDIFLKIWLIKNGNQNWSSIGLEV